MSNTNSWYKNEEIAPRHFIEIYVIELLIKLRSHSSPNAFLDLWFSEWVTTLKAYLRHILGLSQAYLGQIFVISKAYLRKGLKIKQKMSNLVLWLNLV